MIFSFEKPYFSKQEKFSSIKEIFYWMYSVLYFFDSSNVFSQCKLDMTAGGRNFLLKSGRNVRQELFFFCFCPCKCVSRLYMKFHHLLLR